MEKVALVHDWLTNMGGAERVMATIANELVERGNEVTLVTMKEAKSAYRLDDRVKFVGAKGVFYYL